MESSILWILVFVVSLGVLLWASNFFTDAADQIGIFFGIPRFIVGVTILAIGTSLPELVSSIFAVLSGTSEIVVGNVVGSNITNLCLIIGLSAVFAKRMTTSYDLIAIDLPLFIGSALLFSLMVWDGSFSLPEGILSICGIVVYLVYAVTVDRELEGAASADGSENRLGWKPPMLLVLSSVFIFFGAKYTVESVINISQIFNIAPAIIAVTAVAIGTSLPELVVSITAAKKGMSELAIGNVLGSNIFNLFAVMGVSSLFGTIYVPESILSFSLPMMLAVTLIFVFIAQDKIVTRWEGWLFLITYCFFLGRVLEFF